MSTIESTFKASLPSPSSVESEDAQHDRAEKGRGRLGEVPPVGMHVERDRLVVVQELLRVRHGGNSTALTLGSMDPVDCCSTISTPISAAPSPPTSRLVAVIAGAGSGKTRVLTRRVAYRIETGSAVARHTLVLTFTREAAGELRRRLSRSGSATTSRPARSTR